jgi:hypothetical protein
VVVVVIVVVVDYIAHATRKKIKCNKANKTHDNEKERKRSLEYAEAGVEREFAAERIAYGAARA